MQEEAIKITCPTDIPIEYLIAQLEALPSVEFCIADYEAGTISIFTRNNSGTEPNHYSELVNHFSTVVIVASRTSLKFDGFQVTSRPWFK